MHTIFIFFFKICFLDNVLWKHVKFRGLGSKKKLANFGKGGGWSQAKVSQMANFSILTWSLRRSTTKLLRLTKLLRSETTCPLINSVGSGHLSKAERILHDPAFLPGWGGVGQFVPLSPGVGREKICPRWVSTPLLHAWICMLSSKSSGREDRRLLREQKKKEEEGERKSEPEDAGEEDVN